jgi:MoxR-like ATPase
MDIKIAELNEQIRVESAFVEDFRKEMNKVIVGQRRVIERLMTGLLADGHILLEGVPGLAKTLMIRTLADCINADFKRIQFTPDLLPADITGTLIYSQQTGQFIPKKGPIFANFILADEINRAPAKVQSALLEAMQERQVTIGEETYKLPEPFLVLATQNPIEQQGTYPLPEAQVDRFMLKVIVDYPRREEERQIMEIHTQINPPTAQVIVELTKILHAREVIRDVYVDEKIENYILDIVFATRFPEQFGLEELQPLIAWGASPRASMYLRLAAQAHAFLEHRGYVTPEDIRAIAMDVLRHRVLITYEAEAEEKTSEDVIRMVMAKIEVP